MSFSLKPQFFYLENGRWIIIPIPQGHKKIVYLQAIYAGGKKETIFQFLFKLVNSVL